jgi:hypothetical protein
MRKTVCDGGGDIVPSASAVAGVWWILKKKTKTEE